MSVNGLTSEVVKGECVNGLRSEVVMGECVNSSAREMALVIFIVVSAILVTSCSASDVSIPVDRHS